jgi:hypothetical protein
MDARNQDSWERHRYFMGLDWAKQEHAIVVVDGEGRIRLETRIDHTAEGWHAGPNLSMVAVTIETNRGPAVERLLELGCAVYPINPNAAPCYRVRKAPSGGKTDRLDALSFANALRTDGRGWRPLNPEDDQRQSFLPFNDN